MSDEPLGLRQIVRQALSGRGAHTLVQEIADGLDWRAAGRRMDGSPHTIFEIVQHMVYWQRFCLDWIDREKPATPEHASESWPGPAEPPNQAAWADAVGELRTGLSELDDRAREVDLEAVRHGKSLLELLQLVASHNSYHCGQIALLRRQLGEWPPPGGGATW